jgi:hypothetical protein
MARPRKRPTPDPLWRPANLLRQLCHDACRLRIRLTRCACPEHGTLPYCDLTLSVPWRSWEDGVGLN